MLHFSCDLCGRQLNDRRFVVRLEVFPAFDPEELDEDDLDADHLQEVAELIDQLDVTGQCELDNCNSQDFRFDLCPTCQQRFLQDPLGRETPRRLNFSEN